MLPRGFMSRRVQQPIRRQSIVSTHSHLLTMDLTLLSGVVRNRKVMASAVSRSQALFDEGQADTQASHNTIDRLRSYLTKNSIFKKFSLRVHKFAFQWELAIHLLVCMVSLAPFFFTGRRVFSLLPISVWLFYNVLFLIGPQHSNKVIPRFGRIKNSFKNNIEEFFSPKLLPVLSISFLCVVLSLAVTGHRLGGPPLCYHPCGVCLATWEHSIPLSAAAAALVARVDPLVQPLVTPIDSPYDPLNGRMDPLVDAYRVGCGYANGKEMLGYYTMGQTSFLLFIVVVVAVLVCLAWRVADEEKTERRTAEEWLKRDALKAFEMRQTLIEKFGAPGSSVRPEGSAVWVYFGVTAALTFTLLGWHNWYVLPPSNTATLLIILNLLTILMSTLILHLSFFGRLLALYKRNFHRVECLTQLLGKTDKEELDSWWNCRNFVLNDDLSLDYDIGGLAVSATFLIALLLFGALITQLVREGLQGMLEPPGSYLAYACLYITCCLIKLFTLATNTYEEQHRHIAVLQGISNGLYQQGALSTDYNEFMEYKGGVNHTAMGNAGRTHLDSTPWLRNSSDDDFAGLGDDGPLLIDDEESDINITNDHDQDQDQGHSQTLEPASPGRDGRGGGASSNNKRESKDGVKGSGSNVNSPRKPRGKGFPALAFRSNSAEHSDESGTSSPVDKKLTNLHSNKSSTGVSNWLGKNIFGSFKLPDEYSLYNTDEQTALLTNNTTRGSNHVKNSDELSLDVSILEQGGNPGTDSGSTSPVLNQNSLKPSGSQVKLSLQLPRPHNNTAGKSLNIETHSGNASPDITSHTNNNNNNNNNSNNTSGIMKLSPLQSAVHLPFSPLLPLTYSHTSNNNYEGALGPVDTLSVHNNTNTTHTTHNTHTSHATHSHPNIATTSTHNPHNTHTMHTTHSAHNTSNSIPTKPILTRSVSHNASMESYRQTIAEIISQIRRYDPYPCILGIPIMPALFNSSKFYIFVMFTLLGMRTMVACLRQL